ncbi:MAG TPA: glycoside hydrolase family 3 N-terminal domain-containing protein [Candidatus Sulfotelmatobacter sp.]|nr:glycoside hydrolase family 3 N-terminal domain-containing protein [Candidatus Sulfotelmatobacter sp.]
MAGLFLLISGLGMAQTPASTQSPGTADKNLDARVESMLKQMTLEEKVGQLVQYSAGQPTGPGTGRTDYDDMIARGQISSLFNVVDPKLINRYQKIAMEESRLHIPILFGLDVIHGFKTEFPIPLALATTWDPSIVEKASRVAARESAAGGIRWTFSPMVDIARDARWGRMAEGAGEDPFLGSAMAEAYVRGYQGARLNAPDSIAACVKHYVGYGAAEAGRDYNSTEISEHTLRQFYMPPFHAAVNAGTASLMSAFNSLNGIPSSANPFTLKQVLRKEWGFRGLVVSDWNAVGELIPHGIANDGATAARKAFTAGVDMDMVSSLYHDHLEQIVKSGGATLAELDEAVRHVLRVKLALGLFEHPYVDEDAAGKSSIDQEGTALAQTAAERSFVLLKNANGSDGKALLPLAKGTQNIAVIGPLADNSWYPGGAPQGAGIARISLPAALAQRIDDGHISRFKGVDILDGTDDEIAAAVAGAQKADIVILTLGETPEMSGEAASRAHLGFPGRQQELLEAIVRTGKPVVLILFSGRPLTLPWAFEHVPAVIAAWQPGAGGGPALARTLFGEVNPSGKLVVSWPRSVGQEPLYYNHLDTGRPAGNTDLTHPPTDVASKYVSRYIDEQNTPQFTFGYGESYTTFSYGATTISTNRLSAAALNKSLSSVSEVAMTAETEIKNTGSRPGNEVVQLYIQLLGTSVAEPVRMLKGFQTISIAVGETKKVKFDLRPEAFAIWNDHNRFTAEAAKVNVWISPDSSQGSPAQAEIMP